MTKKIFKSIMFVCALVLAVGLAAVMGILYSNFDGQKILRIKVQELLILIRMEQYCLIMKLMFLR